MEREPSHAVLWRRRPDSKCGPFVSKQQSHPNFGFFRLIEDLLVVIRRFWCRHSARGIKQVRVDVVAINFVFTRKSSFERQRD
jgi:hypothetical protein